MPVTTMEDAQERFGAPLLELWGMTELAGLGTTHAWYAESRLGSIGVAPPYVECRIADVDDAADTLSPGEIGELMVRGPIVMQGYFGNDEATAETIEPDGWLHTGDLARMDDEGYFFVVDRKKDMILTAGYNVYPAEIERVLTQHPAVAMSAVGRVADELKGELAKAYVVLKPDATLEEQALVDFCREQLAAYKVPRAGATRRAVRRHAPDHEQRQDHAPGARQTRHVGKSPGGRRSLAVLPARKDREPAWPAAPRQFGPDDVNNDVDAGFLP